MAGIKSLDLLTYLTLTSQYLQRGRLRDFRNDSHQAKSLERLPFCNQFRPALIRDVRFRSGAFLGGCVRSGEELHIGPLTTRKVGDHDG